MELHWFDIARHVIDGLSLIASGSDEAREWAAFLLGASKRVEAGAFHTLQCVVGAQVLLGMERIEAVRDSSKAALNSDPLIRSARINEWQNHYKFTLDVSFTRAELEYLNQNYQVCESECRDALQFVDSLLDRVNFREIQQDLLTACHGLRRVQSESPKPWLNSASRSHFERRNSTSHKRWKRPSCRSRWRHRLAPCSATSCLRCWWRNSIETGRSQILPIA